MCTCQREKYNRRKHDKAGVQEPIPSHLSPPLSLPLHRTVCDAGTRPEAELRPKDRGADDEPAGIAHVRDAAARAHAEHRGVQHGRRAEREDARQESVQPPENHQFERSWSIQCTTSRRRRRGERMGSSFAFSCSGIGSSKAIQNENRAASAGMGT